MDLAPLVRVMVMASILPCFASVNLSGKVVQIDGLPRSGVVVSLSGTSFSDTSNASGEWLLVDATTGSKRLAEPARPVSSHLVVSNGRIGFSFAGRTVFGRELPNTMTSASPSYLTRAARVTASSSGYDTLVYSWNGKPFLRDTIAHDSLVRKAIIRRFDTTVNSSITYSYVSDTLKNFYRTARIGGDGSTWMVENLNIPVDSSWCYADNPDFCTIYGRLYSWPAAMNLPDSCYSSNCENLVLPIHQGVCPSGWHLPTLNDWRLVGGSLSTAGQQIKATVGWGNSMFDRDPVGFRALSAGARNPIGQMVGLGRSTGFWTSSVSEIGAFSCSLYEYKDYLRCSGNTVEVGYSVRCIKTEPWEN